MASHHHHRAIVVHATGWVVLVVTAMLARSGAVGTGWPAWSALALGCLAFAVLAAWSARQMTARFQPPDVPARTGPIDGLRRLHASERIHRLPTPVRRRTFSWRTSSDYGSTTIRRRDDAPAL